MVNINWLITKQPSIVQIQTVIFIQEKSEELKAIDWLIQEEAWKVRQDR